MIHTAKFGGIDRLRRRPRFVASGATFDPLSLSPAIWLDAFQQTGYANNANATTATDFSGNSRHFTEASVPPVFKTNVLNGKPGFYFDGTKRLLRSYTGSGTAYSIMAVVNRDDDVFRVLWANGIDPYLGMQTSRRPAFYQGAGVTAGMSCLPVSTTEAMILGMRVTAGTCELFDGKTRVATGATTSSALKVSGLSNLAGFFWSGHMHEVLAFNSRLSDTDWTALANYLRDKWALKDRWRIVLDGDSITAGTGASAPANAWASLLAASLGTDGYHVGNFGISGQTVGNATAGGGPAIYMRLNAATEEYTAGLRTSGNNVLVAWGGTNDLYYGRTAAQAFADFEAYCQGARTAGYKVLAVGMIDRNPTGSWTGAKRTDLNNLCVNAVGMYDAYLDPSDVDARFDDYTSALFADGVHPSDAGHAILASAIETQIRALL
jgi:lysophospholipase L1-like esterase